MGRSATLKPFKVAGRIKPWCVSIPPYLSSTAKRQRLYFATRDDALRECDRLRVRKDNFGISLTSMTASRIAEAAEVYNLLVRGQLVGSRARLPAPAQRKDRQQTVAGCF